VGAREQRKAADALLQDDGTHGGHTRLHIFWHILNLLLVNVHLLPNLQVLHSRAA
jgi:hypothetical protein